MKTPNKYLLLVMLVAGFAVAFRDSEKTFDFSFREMELRIAVQSVAKLMNRYVIFKTPALGAAAITMELTDVTPEFALQMLLESNGLFANEKGGVYYIQPQADRKPAALTPVIIPLVNVTAKDLEQNVKGFLGKDLTYTINEQKNAFIVAGPDETISALKQLISELDQEVSQIHIEARIIEVSREFSRNFGIEWGREGVMSSTLGGGQGINVSANPGFQGNFRVGLLGKGSPIDAHITALERDGKAKILSSPKITTLNGTAATISSTTTLTFLSDTSSTTVGTTTTGKTLTQTTSSALTFTVTPIIVSDDQVRLNVTITKVDPGTKVDGAATNTTNNSVTTSFMVRTGQTAGIAGMSTKYNTDNTSGVPFLSSIPVIGALFGSVKKEENERDLLVFMTPQIYKGTNQNLHRRRPNEMELTPEEMGDTEAALDNLHGATMTAPIENGDAVAKKENPPVIDPPNAHPESEDLKTAGPQPASVAVPEAATEKAVANEVATPPKTTP